MTNKLPPHNVDAERAVLGSILIDPECVFDILAIGLQARDFYGGTHRACFDAIAKLAGRRAPIDHMTVFNEIKTGDDDADGGRLAELISFVSEVPTSINAVTYATIVKNDAMRREIIRQCGEVASMAYDDTVEIIDIVEKQQAGAAEVTANANADHKPIDSATSAAAYVDAFELLQKHQSASLFSLPTGLTDLDKALGGGLQRGEVCYIGARPGVGKSTVLQNVAFNMAEAGHHVYYWSGEMAPAQLTARALARRLSVPYRDLLDSSYLLGLTDAETAALSARIYAEVHAMSLLPIVYDHQSPIHPVELSSKVIMHHLRDGVDAVVVDYLGLMKAAKPSGNQAVDVGAISAALKALAMSLNIVVIAAVQLNRNVEHTADKKPQLWSSRSSGAIEQDAAVVLMLYREGYYQEDMAGAPPDNDLEIYIRKNRYAETGIVRAFVDLPTNRVLNAATLSQLNGAHP